MRREMWCSQEPTSKKARRSSSNTASWNTGRLWGHGAYLGPDYSAEYLHRLSEVTRDTIAVEKYGRPFAQLSPG